jgi:hypothetical protein
VLEKLKRYLIMSTLEKVLEIKAEVTDMLLKKELAKDSLIAVALKSILTDIETLGY